MTAMATVPAGPITIDGVTYTGVHALCTHNRDKAAREFRAALRQERRYGDAEAAIGREIKRLLLPGVKRKTYRRDELQAIVDRAYQACGVRSEVVA